MKEGSAGAGSIRRNSMHSFDHGDKAAGEAEEGEVSDGTPKLRTSCPPQSTLF